MKSRYIPFTQQPYCCTPTSIQMVMYKNDIPLQSQEDIGYEIGLSVPKESADLFTRVRTKMPVTGIWGTQVGNPDYEPNKAFKKLGIPLRVELRLISTIKSAAELKQLLTDIEKDDGDAALCFAYGNLWDTDSTSGHVCIFNSVEGNSAWMIDPERNVPKYRRTPLDKLYEAMKVHGDAKSGGVWIFEANK